MPGKAPKIPRAPGVVRRRRRPAHASTGLAAIELQAAAPPNDGAELHRAVKGDGGKVLAMYREPYGSRWLVLAALPVELVEPTPFQRNLSDIHVRKLELVIGKIGRFLDPIVAVRAPAESGKGVEGAKGYAKYWTPKATIDSRR